MSIEEVSLAVPVEQRARFLDSARRVAERARAARACELALELSLRVLAVLHGAASPNGRGAQS